MPDWYDDPVAFEFAFRTANVIFDWFRPPGDPSGAVIDYAPMEFGRRALLLEIQQADLSTPFEKQTEHQRWLAKMNRAIRPVGSRPIVWGESAADTRDRRSETASFQDEFITLIRKYAEATRKPSKKDPREPGPPLTEAEERKLGELQVRAWKTLTKSQKETLAKLPRKTEEEE
jgi:hypothetical protein